MSGGEIGIFTTDASLVVQTWDPWMEAATGISASDAQNRPLTELVPELESRGILTRLQETLTSGAVHVFAPAFHRYIVPASPLTPSRHFERMQQRVTVAPLFDNDVTIGVVVTVQDVTRQLDAERDLRDEDWRVRRAAVNALARAADADLIDAVLATLRREHRNFSTLSSALKLLAATDIDITAPLARLLAEKDADLRIQAALSLGDQHDGGAIEALIGALDDPDPNVCFHVIESLGRLRADAAAEPLAGIIESRDFFLSFAALDAIALINDARIAPRLIPLLDDDALRPAVAHALRSIADDRVVEPLVDILNRTPAAALPVVTALAAISDRCAKQARSSSHVPVTVEQQLTSDGRAHVLQVIHRADAESLPSVVTFLGWLTSDADATALLTRLLENAEVRQVAIDAIVHHGEAAVDPLLGLLNVEDTEVRRAAVAALARLGSRRSTSALVQLLGDPALAVAAAGALAQIGDPAAFEPLLDMIGRPEPAVRQAAIGALNSIGHPSMSARVVTMMTAADPVVRESAVRIAGYFGYRETTEHVIAAASDPVESVRVAALEHLPFLEDQRASVLLQHALQQDAPKAKAAAARALARVDHDDASRSLLAATADADGWVRYFAAGALGERVYLPAASRLGALAEFDPMPHVRTAAVNALAAGYSNSPAGLLERCAADPEHDVASAALGALGRIGGAGALESLRAAARDDQAWKRLAAVRGLAAHASPEAVSQLEWLAGGDVDTGVTEAAISALGEVASGGGQATVIAVDALVSLCADPGRRDAAVGVMSGLAPGLIPTVGRGLSHPLPAVRKRIVDALGRFLHPDATALVVKAFEDEDAAVRETAVIALGRLGSASSEGPLKRLASADPSKAVRRAAASALASMRRSG